MKNLITSLLIASLVLTGMAGVAFGEEADEEPQEGVVLEDTIDDYISWGDGVKELSSDPIEVTVTNDLDASIIEVTEYDNTEAELFTFALETPEGEVMQIQFDHEEGEWTESVVEDGEWVEQDKLSDFYTVEYEEGEGYELELDFGYDQDYKLGIDYKYEDGNQSFYTASEDSYNLWYNGENYTSSDNYVEMETAEKPATEDYELQEDEVLSDLVERADFTMEELLALNPDIENADEVDEGQVIEVPEDSEIEKYCLPEEYTDDEDTEDPEETEEDETNYLVPAIVGGILGLGVVGGTAYKKRKNN